MVSDAFAFKIFLAPIVLFLIGFIPGFYLPFYMLSTDKDKIPILITLFTSLVIGVIIGAIGFYPVLNFFTSFKAIDNDIIEIGLPLVEMAVVVIHFFFFRKPKKKTKSASARR